MSVAVFGFALPACVEWRGATNSPSTGSPSSARGKVQRESGVGTTSNARRVEEDRVDVAKSTVEKHMLRRPKPPSPTWMTFLRNHVSEMISIGFLVVPTIKFEVLFVFVILAPDRRGVLHCNVTAHPTAGWTAQQIDEVFPSGDVPRHLLRDRDGLYGDDFRRRMYGLGIKGTTISPRRPWQRPYIRRPIGSIRREFPTAPRLS